MTTDSGYFHWLDFAHVGVYALGVTAGFPFQWLLSGKPEILALSGLGLAVGLGILLYTLYQRMTGLTSGFHSRYRELAPLVPLRLGLKESCMVAGFLACYVCNLTAPLFMAAACVSWLAHGVLAPWKYDEWRAWAWLVCVFSMLELALLLKRHFPEERHMKLLAFFSLPVIVLGAAMYRFGWSFFSRDTHWEAATFVFLALFIFGMSLVGKQTPQRGREDGGDEPRK